MIRLSRFAFATASLAALCGSQTFADTARSKLTIDGTGRSSAAPEYVQVHVTVTSLCYDTSVGAKDANAVLANKIVAALKSYATDPKDKVTASGGQNVRQTETVQDGTTWKTLCTMKWRSTNDLTIQMANISELPALQDKVLGVVDQVSGVNPSLTAQTYADMAAPVFSLYPDTQTRIRNLADTNAYDDAKSQRDAFAAHCGFSDLHLDSIQPPRYEYGPRAQGAALPSAADNTVTPILPDEIAVTATWTFDWSFVPGANCAP